MVVTIRGESGARAVGQRRIAVRPGSVAHVTIPGVRSNARSEVVAELWARRGRQYVRSVLATRRSDAAVAGLTVGKA